MTNANVLQKSRSGFVRGHYYWNLQKENNRQDLKNLLRKLPHQKKQQLKTLCDSVKNKSSYDVSQRKIRDIRRKFLAILGGSEKKDKLSDISTTELIRITAKEYCPKIIKRAVYRVDRRE